MNKTACSFTACQEKWHKGGGKLVMQTFAFGTWGEMVALQKTNTELQPVGGGSPQRAQT